MYSINGKDEQGEINVERRYNHFFVLRQRLTERWPGVYIPPIPSKKVIGNSDQKLIQSRTFILERFLKQMKYDSKLFFSEEMKIFLRSTGDVEKAL